MSALLDINNMLDSDFDSCFELPSFIENDEHTDKEYSIDCFKYCFQLHYENDRRCLAGRVSDLCDTENIIEMSKYLADRYDQEEIIPNISIDTENPRIGARRRSQFIIYKIVQEYIYYYLNEIKYPEFIQQIENYWSHQSTRTG
tara:strand:+ start:4035 stop:4466 length:432 start_codon:yes stop_codon:yes gene_type:complete